MSRRAAALPFLALPLAVLALAAWTRARSIARSPDDWRLALAVLGVLSMLGVLWFVRWVIRTAMDRAVLNAQLKALDSPEVQKKLGKVIREEVLAPEIEKLSRAVSGAEQCADRWGTFSDDLDDIEQVARVAYDVARVNRSWLEDLNNALNVALQIERRSGGDRRHADGFVIPALPTVLPDLPDRRAAGAERRTSGPMRRRSD